jgi:DNA end-binding protein Ku
MRSFWSGEIQFGLVNIPVKLYTATKDLSPSFNQLHIVCSSPMKQKRWCECCNTEVPWSEVGKGYAVSKDKFVLFTKEELALQEPSTTGTVEIVQFINLSDVDVSYFHDSKWVGPGGNKPKLNRGYELLRHMMTKTQKVALVRITLRTKPRLAILRPEGKHFKLEMLRYHEEMVADELESIEVKPISEKEEGLAVQLMEAFAGGTFDPSKHENDYRKELQRVIDAKVESGETEIGVEHTKIIAPDLALEDLLKQSLSKR